MKEITITAKAYDLFTELLYQAADREGRVEICDGTWLYSAENAVADQEMWDDGDKAKNFDFGTDGYWFISDDGEIGDISEENFARFLCA